MAAKSNALRVALVLVNALFVAHVFFMSSALVETTIALNASLTDLSLWRRLVGQSANLAFFGSFFIFQIVCYAIFFQAIIAKWYYLNVINLVLVISGAAISINGGLGWSLIFPGMTKTAVGASSVTAVEQSKKFSSKGTVVTATDSYDDNTMLVSVPTIGKVRLHAV